MLNAAAQPSLSAPTDDDLLDARAAAALVGRPRKNWWRFAKTHKIPGPAAQNPARWRRGDLTAWLEGVPTIKEVEASGEWVREENSGYSREALWLWRTKGKLKKRHRKRMAVRVQCGERTVVRRLYFCLKAAVDRVGAANKRSGSRKTRERYEEIVTDAQGEEWLLVKAAAKFLGVVPSTLRDWSDVVKGGCPYLKNNAALRTTLEYPPYRRWALSSLKEAAAGRADPPARTDVYTMEETHRLTGFGKRTLRKANKSQAVGLGHVLVHSKVPRADHVIRIRTAGFDKAVVDAFVKANPGIPPERQKLADAARALGIDDSTAHRWWRLGYLEGSFAEYPTPEHGREEGILILKASVMTVRGVLSSVKNNVQAAAGILRALKAGEPRPDYSIPKGHLTTRQAIKALKQSCKAAGRGKGVVRNTVVNWCEAGLLTGVFKTYVSSPQKLSKGWLITKESVLVAAKALKQAGGDVKRANHILREKKGLPIHRKPRSPEADEVLAYIYRRWIAGDTGASIRDGAAATFGAARAPKRRTAVTYLAKLYARRHSLPAERGSAAAVGAAVPEPALPAEPPAGGEPAGPQRTGNSGRRVSPQNVAIYKTCYEVYERAKAGEIKMRKAVALVLDEHGPNALGASSATLDDRKRRLRLNARMHEKHKESGGGRN